MAGLLDMNARMVLRIVCLLLSLVMMTHLFSLVVWSTDKVGPIDAASRFTVLAPVTVTGQSGLTFDSDAPLLVWYAGIGCDSSGFFNEIAAILTGLYPLLLSTDGANKLQIQMGQCSEQFLATLIPEEASILAQLQLSNNPQGKTTGTRTSVNDIDWRHSVVVQHKLPGRPFASLFNPGAMTRPLYLIGRIMTESVFVSDAEVGFLEVSSVDEVWVPTSFHSRIYAEHGVSTAKLVVIPPAVNWKYYSSHLLAGGGTATSTITAVSTTATTTVSTAARVHNNEMHVHASVIPPLPVVPADSVSASVESIFDPTLLMFRFVSVFKWEHRKGPDCLLSAYWKAFSLAKHPSVELVLRSYKPHWEPGPTDIDQLINSMAIKLTGLAREQLPRVVVLKTELSKPQLRELYHHSQVFVLPSRGEGFCLPCVEAMAAGLPVIVTNFSGPSEYMDSAHSYPLNYHPQLNRDGSAEPDVDHLQQLMLTAYNDPRGNAIKGMRATDYVYKHYSSSVVALKIAQRLQIIHKKLKRIISTNNSNSTATIIKSSATLI